MLYSENTALSEINEQVKKITDGGETVLATKVSPDKLRYKRLIKV